MSGRIPHNDLGNGDLVSYPTRDASLNRRYVTIDTACAYPASSCLRITEDLRSHAFRRRIALLLVGWMTLSLALIGGVSTAQAESRVPAESAHATHGPLAHVSPEQVKLGADRWWISPTAGLGRPHPRRLHYGGDGYSWITRITWRNWGGRRATGSGIGWFVPRGLSNGEGYDLPIEIKAFNLGSCGNGPAYTAFEMYFPSKGGSFNPFTYFDACVGGIVFNSTDPQIVRPPGSTRLEAVGRPR